MSERHWLTRRTSLVATKAPDVRHSEKRVLHEDTRPTAPEPGPEVAFTGRGLSAGQHLVDVHDHYRRELGQLRDLLYRVRRGATQPGDARGELNKLALRANDWNLGGVCRAHCVSLNQHHTMESYSIFPYLAKKQRTLKPVIDRLTEEHHAIDELLEGIDAALVHLAKNPGDFGPIADAVDLLTDTLLSHFAYEERELIAPLSRYGFFPGQV